MTWSGRLRAAARPTPVAYPRPVQDPLPVWVAVGGSPQSVVRAGALGLPLTLAIIGGQPERFAPLVALYRRAAMQAGHDAAALPLAINTHAFVGETSAAADSAFAQPYLAMMNRIGRERGWPPSGRAEYEALRSPRGAVAAGAPEQVAEKILFEHELFGHSRYIAQMSVGAVEHKRRPALDGVVRHRRWRRSCGPRIERRGPRPRRPRIVTAPRRTRAQFSDTALSFCPGRRPSQEYGPLGSVHAAARRCSRSRARGVGQQLGQRGVQRRRVVRGDEPGRARRRHLAKAADVAEHDRLAEGQRRGQHAREVKPLGAGVGQHDDVGAREQAGELGIGHEPGHEPNPRPAAPEARSDPCAGGRRSTARRRSRPCQAREQRLDPLVGAQQAEEQDHRILGPRPARRAAAPAGELGRDG